MLPFGMVNAFLVREQGMIWVDSGLVKGKDQYLEIFKKLQIRPKAISLILITHGHLDHFANVHELQELTGAPVACHRNAVNFLQTGKNAAVVPCNELGRNVANMIKGNSPVMSKTIEPDIVIDSQLDLSDYGISGKVIHTPGHSSCCVSVVLESGEAIVGDMVVASPITGKACVAYFADDEAALFANLRKLLAVAHIF
jgi:glyoxylase-like metal-dependent hydrolase (beta-lactamase superfamily II)